MRIRLLRFGLLLPIGLIAACSVSEEESRQARATRPNAPTGESHLSRPAEASEAVGSAVAAARTRTLSLTHVAERHPVKGSEPLLARSLQREGHSHYSLIARVGEPLRVGPIRIDAGCVLRFFVARSQVPGVASGTLDVSISSEAGETTQLVHAEKLRWPRAHTDGWIEREVKLPVGEAGAITLRFDAAHESASSALRVAWGSPHLVCPDRGPPPPPPARPHIVLVSIDTLRADHVGAYGYGRDTTPALDALAAESLVFENAYATAPWTLPSHASLLTGLYPEEHGAGHQNVNAPLRVEVATVAETLAAAGYHTIGNTTAGWVSRDYGLARGFSDWTERHGRSLASALPGIFASIEAAPPAPIFLFLHTYDTHSSYVCPAEYDRVRGDGAPGSADADVSQPDAIAWAKLQRAGLDIDLGRFRGIQEVIDAYDACLLYVDEQLGRLFDYLERRGILESALLVVTSDHGESFLERGAYITHAWTFFDEEVRIPLIVRMPGAARRGRVRELVDQTDIAALLLEVAGIDPPSQGLSGASPLARIDGRAPAREFVRGESAFSGGKYARSLDWKLMSAVSPDGVPGLRPPGDLIEGYVHEEQVFQVSQDPGERVNRASDHAALPAQVWILRQLLSTIESPGTAFASQRDFSAKQRDQLEALGYLGAFD